jgi:hypothetical protein
LQEEEQRRLAYLQAGAQGTSFYAQVHKLETGASAIDPAPVRADIAFMDSRKDTADFRAARLTRLLNLHAGHPALAALTPEIEAGLLRFRWALEEPGTDEMVFWGSTCRRPSSPAAGSPANSSWRASGPRSCAG